MLWSTSPAGKSSRTRRDWLGEEWGAGGVFRPDGPGGGVIQDLPVAGCAHPAARERATGGDGHSSGATARDRLCATQTQSPPGEGVASAGIGRDN